MIKKPRIRPSYGVYVVAPEHVFLVSERQYFFLEGEVNVLLVPLLDGQHTVDEILTEVGNKVPFQKVVYALHILEQEGHIIEADDSLPSEMACFWDCMDVDIREAVRNMQEAQVSVQTLGDTNSTALIEALKAIGISAGTGEGFQIVLTDDYLESHLESINKEALAKGRPWMLVKPVGIILWLGPIFYPGVTGCWACMAHRIEVNRQVERYVLERAESKSTMKTSRVKLPTTLQLASNLAAVEVAKWVVTGKNQHLEGKLLTLDLLSLEVQEHVLVKRPQCPVCGDAQYLKPTEPIQMKLQSRKKRYTSDSGHWTMLPEETYNRHKHHISPITGIVSWFKSLEMSDHGLTHNYNTGHHFPIMTDSVLDLQANMRFRSGGKGTTEVQAKVSALGEAIERYSGIFWGDEYTIKSSFKGLGPEAIHPNDCMLYSEEQIRHSQTRKSSRTDDFNFIPVPFEENLEIDWTPIWSLTNHRTRYLPTTYCYYGHPELILSFAASDSNGCAAGNTLEEAILQGFTEMVERDSVAIWWYNRIKRPAVDIDSFDITYVRELKAYYQSIGRELWVLDITSDFGIPAFAVVSRQLARTTEDIFVGFSAYLDPRVALMRAISEANQYLPALSEALADGSTYYRYDKSDAIKWWKTATIENQPYLVPDTNVPPKKLSDYPSLASADLLEDINTCVDIARDHDLEVLVLDQTRPDIGLAVVKVFVPGLRHFWRRLAPGRLYDVPVEMGWLERPLREDELNPFSVFV